MRKIFLILFIIYFGNTCHAQVSESARREYALKFHEAFILQSIGQSTSAFGRFLEAYNAGTKAGESSIKLQVIADLFYWYRQHGACMKLFAKQPTDREKIVGEYCNCGESHESNEGLYRLFHRPPIASSQHNKILANIPDYRSEYGTNPQQAALIRDFLFGTGELIAGILLVSTSKSIAAVGFGGSMIYSGVKTMWNAGNTFWAQHESALLDLKKVTDRAEALAK